MNFWWFHLLLLFWFDKAAIKARMLKKINCNLYDAEFSVIYRNMRFLQGRYSPVLHQTNLRECLTKCVVDKTCFSVNYLKSNETCEFVDIDLYRVSSLTTDQMFDVASGWVHYITKEKKALGPRCSKNNPCLPTERCEDTCQGTHQCVPIANDVASNEILDTYIKNVLQSTTHVAGFTALLAIDRDPETFQHTLIEASGFHWWKVQFNSTVFIHTVKIINRVDCCQDIGNNFNIIATLVTTAQRHDTVCANTGILGAGKTLDCYRFADEMTILGNAHLHLAEVFIFGKYPEQ